MKASCTIFIGDLARAFKNLQPSGQDTHKIARTLGFDIIKPAKKLEIIKRKREKDEDTFVAGEDEKKERTDAPTEPPEPILKDEIENEMLPELEPQPDPLFSDRLPLWLRDAKHLETEEPKHASMDLSLQPLFDPRQARGIVTFSLAIRCHEGPIDIDAIVECLAKDQPVTTVPQLPLATIRFGAQVLLDKREAMEPFFLDQSTILSVLENVVGKEQLEVYTFKVSPMRVSPLSRYFESRDYFPPPAGTPILLVSDLGIGLPPFSTDNPDEEQWIGFADLAKASGCPLIVFCPYPPSRWPSRLARVFTLIQWYCGTTAGTVKRTVGLGHPVKI